MLFKAYKNTKL